MLSKYEVSTKKSSAKLIDELLVDIENGVKSNIENAIKNGEGHDLWENDGDGGGGWISNELGFIENILCDLYPSLSAHYLNLGETYERNAIKELLCHTKYNYLELLHDVYFKLGGTTCMKTFELRDDVQRRDEFHEYILLKLYDLE